MAGTFQRHSGGRLLLNVVTGGEPHEQRAYGDFLDKQARYARTAEFLHVVRQLWTSQGAGDLRRRAHPGRGRQLNNPPDPIPAVFFGGSSGSAGPVAAKYSDVYLTWGEPLAAVGEKLDWIRGLAVDAGRDLQYGLRIHVISRDTSPRKRGPKPTGCWRPSTRRMSSGCRPAWRAANPKASAACWICTAATAADCWSRPTCGPGWAWSAGERAPPWSGRTPRSPKGWPNTRELGISHFILSGYPHLEEAYWFGEGVLPLLERMGLWSNPNASVATGSATPFAVASAH